ncbi:MAG TPA: hypothetical protein VF263_08015 [Longimicrobiaceae bacterium]
MSAPLLRGPARALLLLLLPALLAAAPAAAQRLRGTVALGKAGVEGVPVTLHRVARDTSGAVATAVTGPGGAFDLPLARGAEGEGFSVFFVTAEFRGVRYFGPPIHPDDAPAAYAVPVYDTVSAAAAAGRVRLAKRDVVIIPEEDGGAEVNEVIRLGNSADRTVVVGSGSSVWEFRLPEGVAAFEVGESDITPQEVVRRGDRVLVTAPLPPGERDLFVRYRLRRGATRTVFPLPSRPDSMSLFVRQPSVEVRVPGFSAPVAVETEGETYLRFTAAAPAAREVVMEWKRAGPPPVDPRIAAAVVTGLVLTAGAGLALRRSPRSGAA